MKNAAAVLVLAMALAGTTSLAADSGADVFKSKCAMCHGADGSGNTPVGKSLKLRDLSSPEVQAQSEADIKTIVEKGKGKMKGFAGTLTPEQIDAVAKHVKTLKK